MYLSGSDGEINLGTSGLGERLGGCVVMIGFDELQFFTAAGISAHSPSPSVFEEFPWPPVTPDRSAPRWTGENFVEGDRSMRVLEYGANPSNWSEELTELHEKEAGSNHPMDLASRELAVRTMMSLRTKTKSQGPSLMDIGCSSGYLVGDLQEAMPEARVIGADFIRGPLERLAGRLNRVPLLQFDLRKCPLPDASLDGVTCLNVLEHIDDDCRSLQHIYRILKPGGIAHIEVPAGPGLYDVYDEFLLHFRRYSMSSLTALAVRCGFLVERTTHLGALVYPAFWLCKKRYLRRLDSSAEEKSRMVAKMIQNSRTNGLFAGMINLEITLGRWVKYPCGVRCVVVLRKPMENNSTSARNAQTGGDL